MMLASPGRRTACKSRTAWDNSAPGLVSAAESPLATPEKLETRKTSAAWKLSKVTQVAEELLKLPPPPGLAPPGLAQARSTEDEEPLGCVAPEHAEATGFDSKHLVGLLQAALSESDVQSKHDGEGFVSLAWLLKAKPELQMRGGSMAFVSAVEEAPCLIRLESPGPRRREHRVRLASLEEVIKDEADRLIQSSPFGVVPLSSLLSSPVLSEAIPHIETARSLVQTALDDTSSEAIVQDSWLVRRPRDAQLRIAMELLFSDHALVKDARLKAKLGERCECEVPLTWVIARYSERLGISFVQENPRSVEAAAEELCAALTKSETISVDPQRLTARRALPLLEAPRSPCSEDDAKGLSPQGPERKIDSRSASRAAAQLRQLLDFYFEPSTLQNNRLLLDLIAKRLPAPKGRGPWLPEALLELSVSFEDLQGLGRVMAQWQKLQHMPDWMSELKDLKHLRCDSEGLLWLSTNFEVRNFVTAECAKRDLAAAAVRYLAASKETRGQAPPGCVSILSYSVKDAMADLESSQRQPLIKRQVLLHHTDLICLQGFDVDGAGAAIGAALTEEGYAFACARADDGDANSIFWDRSRWEQIGQEECEASLFVLLRLFEDPSVQVRAVCFKAKCPDLASGLSHCFGAGAWGTSQPLLVCADLSCLGGAEAAGIVQELMDLPSVAEEVLGAEVAAPERAPPGLQRDRDALPQVCALTELRHPDAVFFRDMMPVTCLSGHTDSYLRTLNAEDLEKQFPSFRLPLVAAFDWHAAASVAQALPAPSHRIRL